MRRFLLIAFAFFTLMIVESEFSRLTAQSLTSTDLSTLNVDDLTDEQIKGYLLQAEERGFTQAQLETLARQRGMSESQISKLRSRIQKLQFGENEKSRPKTKRENSGLRNDPETFEEDVFGKLISDGKKNALTEFQRKLFGYSLFQTDQLNFSPNLNIPTPKDYVLGPGDEIHIDLWGATQASSTLVVSSEGTIRPENLRPIYVNGLTIKEFEEMVDDRLSAIYSGLKGENPSIFYQVSLGNIRTINVSIVGEVNLPGNYALNSLSTVYTGLYAAGGPNENGTFRNIQLIRDNKLIKTIDIYAFLSTGIKVGDERLRDGDVIIVKPYLNRVEVEGEVKRPGFFELNEGETFDDVLRFTSGFTDKSYRSLITVTRNGQKEREILDLSAEKFGEFHPLDGDVYLVKEILERYSNRVQIEGAVYREGEFQLTDGLTLKALIEKADGLRGDAFLTRASIYRTNHDFTQLVVPVDLEKLLSGEIEDVKLQNEDLIKISSIYDLQEEFTVQVSGEIAEQGVYPFFKSMTVEDLIVLSGGLTDGASGSLVEISRRNSESSMSSIAEIITLQIDKSLTLDFEDRTLLLAPFDRVYIRKAPGYTFQQEVSIEGEVGAPGIYSLKTKDERISDLINRAQGLTQYAYPQGAILIRKTEFAEKKSNREINNEYLLELREKLMADNSGLMNLSQQELLNRLEQIENTSERIESGDDTKGSRIKKDLIQEVAEQDSLITNIEIKDEEPVALDLLEILDNPGSKYDFILKEGDVISIPGRLETVRVAGEVTSPLNLRYDKSYSFKDYIDQSGGFLQTAKKSRSYVQYPNGKRKGTKRFLFFKFYPKIEPGTTIFVARKPERNSLGTAEWLAIASSLATIALTVNTLAN